MPPLAHAAKLGEAISGDRRRLGWALWLALMLGIVLRVFLTFVWGYKHGAYNFNDYPFSSGSKAAFGSALKKIQNPVDTDWRRVGFMVIGSGIMGLLVLLRYRFPGWPLHPIGFTIPLVYPTRNSVFALVLAWAIKSIVVRVGGVTVHSR